MLVEIYNREEKTISSNLLFAQSKTLLNPLKNFSLLFHPNLFLSFYISVSQFSGVLSYFNIILLPSVFINRSLMLEDQVQLLKHVVVYLCIIFENVTQVYNSCLVETRFKIAVGGFGKLLYKNARTSCYCKDILNCL